MHLSGGDRALWATEYEVLDDDDCDDVAYVVRNEREEVGQRDEESMSSCY